MQESSKINRTKTAMVQAEGKKQSSYVVQLTIGQQKTTTTTTLAKKCASHRRNNNKNGNQPGVQAEVSRAAAQQQ